MHSRFSWIVALVIALVSSAGCAPIRYGTQEVWLGHDAKADTLQLGIIYDAIEAEPQNNSDGVKTGFDFASRASAGKRVFFIFDWPFCFNLEVSSEPSEAAAEDSADESKAWERDMLAQLKDLSAVESGYFSDTQVRLGLYQRFKLAHASRIVELLDRRLLMAISEAIATGEFEKDTPMLDARTRELWIAMAREKKRWLTLNGGALSVDLPLTSACAARLLADLTPGVTDKPNDARFFTGLFSHLSELRIADEHILLRWKLEGPTWTFKGKDTGYDDTLATGLHKSGALPKSLPSREAIAASFQQH